jgi:hypothetical protein
VARGGLRQTGLADIVIPFGFRFVWGPLPSDADLVTSLSRGSPQRDGTINLWLRNSYRKHFGEIAENGIGLIDLCERCETIELWIDPDPNSQLTLIWLLDYLRQHARIAPKLTLVQADVAIGNHLPDEVATWRLAATKIRNDHLEAASMAWQAYRKPTPQEWFNLLGADLSVLPQLRHSVLELLEELPMPATGLGATEMRMLELISAGKAGPFDVFPGDKNATNGACLATGKSERYWMGSLIVRRRPCPVSTRGRSRWRCTRTAIVMSDTNKASWSSPRSARLFWRGLKISAGATRSIAGGAAPN